MLKHEIPYHHDSAQLFERIQHLPWPMFLDSGQMLDASTGKPGSQYGRYDIIVVEPFITLVTRGKVTNIAQSGEVQTSEEDPFLLLKNLLQRYPVPKTDLPFAGGDLPFAGGAVGYFGYDLARRIEKLQSKAIVAEEIPEMMVGLYDSAIVVDHREQRSFLISHGLNAETDEKWHATGLLHSSAGLQANGPDHPLSNSLHEFDSPCIHAPSRESFLNYFEVKTPVISNLSEPQYGQAFAKIKAYITAGDCYQVNLAQRFSAEVAGDSWQMYKKLREISPAPFMAFMDLPLNEKEHEKEHFQVLSNSPERFIQITGNHVETRPIKGTRPRSSNPEEDLANLNGLLTSEKDKAENLMIVDLLRNDLSKSCEKVQVNQLFQLQSFANVHHLVSIIVAKLKVGKTAVDVLRSCFPGGSITGAPKLRSMQIIEELEPHRRGVYCGAIGYIGFDSNMDTNIAIRTAIVCKNKLSFYAGGGIVSDSDELKEYIETLDKASSFTAIIKYFTRL
jgi:para-aminobenzoate synthetase component 1